MPLRWEKGTLQKILAANPDDHLKVLQIFVHDKPDAPQKCSKEMNQSFAKLITEHFLGERIDDTNVACGQVVLQAIQQLSKFEDDDGFPVLVKNGLIDIVFKAMQELLSRLAGNASSECDKLYEEILETIFAISEYGVTMKCKAFDACGYILLRTIMSDEFRFITRMETLKIFNSLLEGCPPSTRDNFRDAPINAQPIKTLASLLTKVGDYEFQVGVIESLFRLTNKARRRYFVKRWISKPQSAKAFLKIRDSEFETDCRSFLNTLNENGSGGVHSIGCESVQMGDFQLEKPSDTNYEMFWVDFNTTSNRITIFCSQMPTLSQENEAEEGMWETVSIFDSNVKTYQLHKTEGTILEISLALPVRDLITFGPNIEGSTLIIAFPADVDITGPLYQTLDRSKQASSKKSHLKCSQPISRLLLSTFSDPVVVRLPIPNLTKSALQNQEYSQSTVDDCSMRTEGGTQVQRVRKASVPQVPMSSTRASLQPAHKYTPLTMEHTPSRHRTTPDIADTSSSAKGVSVRDRAEVCGKQATTRAHPETPLPPIIQLSAERAGDTLSEMSASFNKKISIGVSLTPANKERDEIIPSSCPEENCVIPDSQDNPLLMGLLRSSGARPDGVTPENQETDEYEKSRRRGKMAALKNRLSATDPGYTCIPTNSYKVSNTPTLSTVTEESGGKTSPEVGFTRNTPQTCAKMTSIPEDEEEEEQTRKEMEKVNPVETEVVSPDSTSQGAGRKQRVSNRKRKSKKKQNLPPPRGKRSTRSQSRSNTQSQEFNNEDEQIEDHNEDKASMAIPKIINKSRNMEEKKDKLTDSSPQPEDHYSDSVIASQCSDIIASSQYATNPGSANSISRVNEPKFFKARFRERLAQQSFRAQAEVVEAQQKPKSESKSSPESSAGQQPLKKTYTSKSKSRETQIVHSQSPPNEVGFDRSSNEGSVSKKPTKRKCYDQPPPSPAKISPVYEFHGGRSNLENKQRSNTNANGKPVKKSGAAVKKEPVIDTKKFYNKSKNPVQTGKSKRGGQPLKDPIREIQRRNKAPASILSKKKVETTQDTFDIEDDVSISDSETKEKTARYNDEPTQNNHTVSDFAKVCQGLIKNSGGKVMPRQRATKPVTYKDLSDSEIDESPMTDLRQEKSSRRTSFDPSILDNEKTKSTTKNKNKKSRSIFTETEDNMSIRSEVSWLGSTARKKKNATPLKAYTKKAKKQTVRRGTCLQPSDESEEEEVPKKPTKKAKRGRQKEKHVTSDEGSDNELYYERPKSKKRSENKENENSSRRHQQSLNSSASGSCNRSASKSALRVLATSNTPLDNEYGEVETMRHEEEALTPYLVVESPYKPADISFASLERKVPAGKDLSGTDESDEKYDCPQMDMLTPRTELTQMSSIAGSMPSPSIPPSIDVPSETPSRAESVKRKKTKGKDKQIDSRKRRRKMVQEEAVSSESERSEAVESEAEDEQGEVTPETDMPMFGSSLLGAFQPKQLFNKPKAAAETEELNDEEEEDEEDEESDGMDDNPSTSLDYRSGHTAPDGNFDASIVSILHGFGTDIQRNVQRKQQMLDQVTKDTLKVTQKRMGSIWQECQIKRSAAIKSFGAVLVGEITSLEQELLQLKKAEEEAQAFYKKQLASVQSFRTSNLRRVQRIRKKGSTFIESVESAEKDDQKKQESVKDLMKKEMQAMQKKLMQQSQKQELSQMRKALHSMFL